MMVISVILALVAILRARETRGLPIGERAGPDVIERVRSIVARQEWVAGVNHVRTVHTGPKQIVVAISADIAGHITM